MRTLLISLLPLKQSEQVRNLKLTPKKLVCALISSRLHNVMLYFHDYRKRELEQLQHIQNTTARGLEGHFSAEITLLAFSAIQNHLQILLTMFDALNGLAPLCSCSLVITQSSPSSHQVEDFCTYN